jgi:hypothetical protein
MDAKPPHPYVDKVNTRYLETLLGYNARRAALAVIGVFLERMAVYDLRPVDFSVLSLVTHNPGITSRQLCAALNILAPNLVGMVNALEKRGLIVRQPHPLDGRAMGLHLTSCRPDPDAQRGENRCPTGSRQHSAIDRCRAQDAAAIAEEGLQVGRSATRTDSCLRIFHRGLVALLTMNCGQMG